jgi:thiol-disulfide isomerase/thioredoxin
MIKIRTVVGLLLASILLLSQVESYGQEVEVVSFKQFQEILEKETGKVKVVNFWATWCKPCIKEIPYFEALNKDKDGEVDVILVSLDFPDDLNNKLIPYIKRKNMQSRILLMNDMDYNSWIDLVDETWSGAIPATLVIGKDTSRKTFYEGELEQEQLTELIKPYLQ